MHVYSTLRNGLKGGKEGYSIVLSRTMTMVSNGCIYYTACPIYVATYIIHIHSFI